MPLTQEQLDELRMRPWAVIQHLSDGVLISMGNYLAQSHATSAAATHSRGNKDGVYLVAHIRGIVAQPIPTTPQVPMYYSTATNEKGELIK